MKEEKESPAKDARLTPEEFVLRAIEKLADPGVNTIHVVWSGMNTAFETYFPGMKPKEVVKRMVAEGKISMRPTRGGVRIGLPGAIKMPVSAKGVLDKMGLS